MKKVMLITLVVLAFGMFATAQIQNPTSDVLGAHLNYGRGCAACHAPHSGVYGNGNAKTADTDPGQYRSVGRGCSQPLFGKTYQYRPERARGVQLTLPSHLGRRRTRTPAGLLMCLSCHDGNYATGAMMKNKVYETLPQAMARNNIPTLLGNDGRQRATISTITR